ncbi:T9SS type A sorting domain-containing protein [Flavobacterium amnicola]|uniref:T9SS type A sorting domain-containing protein n=1 Tax=Flavobacterium amnicola TaxID=2506422 RepID=A0A4Q1K646_9FLAO|nr:T9SS type A sorting domain-containing protein [Flavobacterium amnicola]RXR21288.1 T9SS type A sorting domain-containing protein [Flavobacterium amnicola]
MKNILSIFLLFFVFATNAQTINFTGCPNLFASSSYTFNLTGSSAGRNIYTTTPITGDQSCPGLGVCEFQISWNAANSRWEFIADDGNGDFSGYNLIYYNTSASTPNPPSLSLGVWTENVPTTTGQCAGNLTSGNSTLTGSVQNVLARNDYMYDNSIQIYPNPVATVLKINSPNRIEKAMIYNLQGQLISEVNQSNELDFSTFQAGMYLVKIISEKGIKIQNIIKQ